MAQALSIYVQVAALPISPVPIKDSGTQYADSLVDFIKSKGGMITDIEYTEFIRDHAEFGRYLKGSNMKLKEFCGRFYEKGLVYKHLCTAIIFKVFVRLPSYKSIPCTAWAKQNCARGFLRTFLHEGVDEYLGVLNPPPRPSILPPQPSIPGRHSSVTGQSTSKIPIYPSFNKPDHNNQDLECWK
jgi:hypothetical protein